LIGTLFWVGVCALLVTAGGWLILRFRGNLAEDASNSSELLVNFEELHARGDLSDEEYRTIRTMLAGEKQQQLKGTKKSG
jgi:uncharacterized membrane protein